MCGKQSVKLLTVVKSVKPRAQAHTSACPRKSQASDLSPRLPLKIQAQEFSWPSSQLMVSHGRRLKAPAIQAPPRP